MFQDLKFSLRSLKRNPAFTIGAILTLALGIGVNSTIFTLANGALFRGMPGLSEPERVRGHLVSGTYFGTLGVTPQLGRVLNDTDDRRGAARAVVVVSHRLWQQRFGGAPGILQQTVTINGRPFAVVGVAPRGFSGPALGEGADLWVPLSLWPDLHADERGLLDDRGASWLVVMGRLQPGTSAAQAQAALSPVAARRAREYPEADGDRLVAVSATGSALSPQGRAEMIPLSALLLTVTALVLLIACANIANLLLARGAARAPEIGVRAALGATRGRLVRQLLTESAVLAAAGAGVGLLLSFWGSDLLAAALPDADFQGLLASTDIRVLLFTAGLAAVSVCAFGIVPALSAARRSLLPRDTAGAGTRTRLQGAFVVAQLSLSLVLLLGAGLSVRALQHATAIDPGFDPHGVLTASYDLVLQNYPAERRGTFRRDLLARVTALPGVTEASLANLAPLSGTMVGSGVADAGRAASDSTAVTYVNGVGPGYFRTLGIPILRGRGIDASDVHGARGVAVVNETLAARLWGDGDPVGRLVRLGAATFEVVGLARNAKYDEATEDPHSFLYTSLEQQSHIDREVLLVRAGGSPAALAAAVKDVVHALDPALPVFEMQTLDAGLAQRADKQRAISGLVAGFGLLALLLAAIGLYGVMAYTVARRRREIGVRLALGATPSQLTRLIALDGLRLAAAGVAVGSLLALPLARALGALVFGVGIGDAAGFAAACGLLVVVALVASALPARRAGGLDPIAALRAE
jgi:putative ABC transport system permease protein